MVVGTATPRRTLPVRNNADASAGRRAATSMDLPKPVSRPARVSIRVSQSGSEAIRESN
jgi:hypothetical protein